MPTPLMTWRTSAYHELIGTKNVAWCLASMRAAFLAEVAANPSTHLWTIASYDAPNGVLVLKPSANNTSANQARRIMVFGGLTPVAAAIGSASSSNANLYAGSAPNANVDTPDALYNAGVPFTTGPWVPAGLCSTGFAFTVALEGAQYFECQDGIVFCWRGPALTAANSSILMVACGGLAVDATDETIREACWGHASSSGATTPFSQIATQASFLPFSTELTSTQGRGWVCPDGASVERWVVAMTYARANEGSGGLLTPTRAYYFPILITSLSGMANVGKLRQMSFGPPGNIGSVIPGPSGSSIAVSIRTNAASSDALRLTNFRV